MQFNFRPVYNTHYEPTPYPKEPNLEEKKVTPETTDYEIKMKESENCLNFQQESIRDLKDLIYQNSFESQEK